MEFKNSQELSATNPFKPVAINYSPNVLETLAQKLTDLESSLSYNRAVFRFSCTYNNENWDASAGLSLTRSDYYPIYWPPRFAFPSVTQYRLPTSVLKKSYLGEVRATYYRGEIIDAKAVAAFLMQSLGFSEQQANSCISVVGSQPSRYDCSVFYAKAWLVMLTLDGYERAGNIVFLDTNPDNPAAAAGAMQAAFMSGHLMVRRSDISDMEHGKVVNALTETKYTKKCNICGVTSAQVNDINVVRKLEVNQDALKLGLSTLHCWIRTFEYIIHLGYKMDNKAAQARTPEQKQSVAERKAKLQSEFYGRLQLIVDKPKVGFGNSNDGNTARRAFANAEVFAEITGVNVSVINRLHTVLRAVSSGHELKSEQFLEYCHKTIDLILSIYEWYPLPPSVHKMLEHGADVALHLELPIGVYSEESQEAMNKEIRKARLNHTAKVSRMNVMKNQYNWLLVKSDPLVSSKAFKKSKPKDVQKLSKEVESLLIIA